MKIKSLLTTEIVLAVVGIIVAIIIGVYHYNALKEVQKLCILKS